MKKDDIFSSAKWVGTKDVNTPYVRGTFHISEIGSCKIDICGLGFFYLYINGKKVSDDIFAPVRSDYVKRDIRVDSQPFDEEMNHRVYVMEYDISKYIVQGDNSICVFLGPGFFDNYAWSYDEKVRYGTVRLIYNITNTKPNGEKENFVSNEDNRFHFSPLVKSDVFKGEVFDFSNYAYDDYLSCPTSDWEKVEILEDMDTDYCIQTCPNDAIIRKVEPKHIRTFDTTKIYDIGENTTAWITVKCNGNFGDVVTIKYSEELNQVKALSKDFMYDQSTTIIQDSKVRFVKPCFVWYGFRYFSIDGDCEIESVEVVHANIQKALSFECSNKTFNWIFETYLRTQLSNMHSGVPSDCPHIERRGYTGDGQLCAKSGMLFLSSKEFYKKWIDDILDCQDRISGHVQYTAPYQRCGGGPGGWGIAIVVVPYEYYRRFDEIDVLEKSYPQMLNYLKYLDDHSENGIVVSDRKGAWCLGDWCIPTKKHLSNDFVNTYFHIKALNLVEEIEDFLNIEHHDKDSKHKNEIIKALNDRFYDQKTGSYAGGINGADAFALDIGLGTKQTVLNLISKYKELKEFDTGIFGTEILTKVLLKYGQEQLVYDLITSEHDVSFETLRKAGATTFWEYWPGTYERSHNHPMFGGLSYLLVTDVLGIRNANNTSGYKEIVINPRMANTLKRASGALTTENGVIKVTYANLTNYTFTIVLPKGIKAFFKYGKEKRTLTPGENVIIVKKEIPSHDK